MTQTITDKKIKPLTSVQYFDAVAEQTPFRLKEQLVKMYCDNDIFSRQIIIMCIGSDRSTGDSLGPLIGYKLEKFHLPQICIKGTLREPVHAANLSAHLMELNAKFDNPFIIAVDASLGSKEHIGYITLGNGPLRPGLGVNKDLPNVGNIHITGIVNFSGMMESLLLQTTRLSKVMQLADTVSKALLYSLIEYFEI